MIERLALTVERNGRWLRYPATAEFANGRITFADAPFALKDELKAMKGAKWHGYDEPPRKCWSIADCPRNRFQLDYLRGLTPYAWFDRPIIKHDYTRPLNAIQRDLADGGLTHHYQIFASEMGTGKTLAAQEVIERSGIRSWWWVGPKTSLPNIQREFDKWGFDCQKIAVEFLTYEALTSRAFDDPPQGVIFDEASRVKNANAGRSQSAQDLADSIRARFGYEGYCLLMSGTPSPKTPLDWWSLCEIAWPGYLKEGSPKALEKRLAYLCPVDVPGIVANKRTGWKDDQRKCDQCGEVACRQEGHKYRPSVNEVAKLYDRLQGLVIVKRKADCLCLPDKRYRVIRCEPTGSTLRLVDTILKTSINTITALTKLREVSDGFLYQEQPHGDTDCPRCHGQPVQEWQPIKTQDLIAGVEPEQAVGPCCVCGGSGRVPVMVRVAKQVGCPKDQALVELLAENEETGRIVIFAGFTGSVDRIVALCHKEGWSTIRCDGRGFEVHDSKSLLLADPLDYWSDVCGNKVAWVAHPESGGMSFTLTEARTAVFWSNSFKPEYRMQAEDRIHRLGMDVNAGCEIVDLLHLPQDQKVLDVIRDNRRLELMTLGEFQQAA